MVKTILKSPTLKFSISGLRGVYPEDIAPPAWVEFVRAFHASLPPGDVAIARDARPTGDALMHIASGVLNLLGRNVHDLGLISTPTIKAYIAEKKLAGGIMVSASHNPVHYNAMKFIAQGGFFFSAKENENFVQALNKKSQWGSVKTQGKTFDRQEIALDLHLRSILKNFNLKNVGVKAIVDPVGSSGGELAALLLDQIGVTATFINREEQSDFPRPPEPVASALSQLSSEVKKSQADIGFAFDPDADRLSLVDETSLAIGEEYTLPLAILSGVQLRQSRVVVNLSTSMMVDAAVEIRGAKLLRSAVGEANVVQMMQKQKAIFGGEGNGGVIDPRVSSYGRDALCGMIHILNLMNSEQSSLSHFTRKLPKLVMRKETRKNISPQKLKKAVGKLKARYPNLKYSSIDGHYFGGLIDKADKNNRAFIHIRSSNTEPIVRLIAEGRSAHIVTALIETTGL